MRFFSCLLILALSSLCATSTAHGDNPFKGSWKPAQRPTPAAFYPKTWALPLEVNEMNTQVVFKVDSTFKLVVGHPLKPTGRVWLEDPKDPLSVKASITFPVSQFETGSGSRDAEMREAMAAQKFPVVRLDVSSLEGVCAPEKAEVSIGCTAKMKATLTIRDVTKEISLPYDIKLQGREYVVAGQIPLRWDEYNVEDPSGFFTRLDKTMYLTYRMALPLKESAAP